VGALGLAFGLIAQVWREAKRSATGYIGISQSQSSTFFGVPRRTYLMSEPSHSDTALIYAKLYLGRASRQWAYRFQCQAQWARDVRKVYRLRCGACRMVVASLIAFIELESGGIAGGAYGASMIHHQLEPDRQMSQEQRADVKALGQSIFLTNEFAGLTGFDKHWTVLREGALRGTA
jgi:hypothetical protein